MGQSIQRNGAWWHQRPDGVWLKWSEEIARWEPQAGAPPPPSRPVPSDEASTSEAPPTDGEFDQTVRLPVAGPQGDTQALPVAFAAPRANAPVFARARRDLSGLRESRLVLGLVASIAVLVAFAVTYAGANKLFSGDLAAASEGARPDGMTARRWTYIQEADAICADGFDRVEQAQRAFFSRIQGMAPAEVQREGEKVVAVFEDFLTSLEKLSRPDQGRRLLDRFFGEARAIITSFDRVMAAAERQDPAALERASEAIRAHGARSEVLAGRYGFRRC